MLQFPIHSVVCLFFGVFATHFRCTATLACSHNNGSLMYTLTIYTYKLTAVHAIALK